MAKFEEYVLNWFKKLVEGHKEDKKWLEQMTSELGLECDGDFYKFLMGLDKANWLYCKIFGWSTQIGPIDGLPDAKSFLTHLFEEAVEKYSFTDTMIEDMAAHCLGYDNPKGFFQDLQYGGCASGMVGMFVYNDDCKKFYIEHIEDLETFRREFEDEIGGLTENKRELPHYTFVCWLCYEMLADKIAYYLWEDEF